MPIYLGEGPHEMYRRKEDGLWYFPGCINGYKTLEEAKQGYNRRDGMCENESDGLTSAFAIVVILILTYIIIFL